MLHVEVYLFYLINDKIVFVRGSLKSVDHIANQQSRIDYTLRVSVRVEVVRV